MTLPTVLYNKALQELSNDIATYLYDSLTDLARRRGITVIYSNSEGCSWINGIYIQDHKLIVVNSRLPIKQKVRVLAQELAYFKLNCKNIGKYIYHINNQNEFTEDYRLNDFTERLIRFLNQVASPEMIKKNSIFQGVSAQ